METHVKSFAIAGRDPVGISEEMKWERSVAFSSTLWKTHFNEALTHPSIKEQGGLT